MLSQAEVSEGKRALSRAGSFCAITSVKICPAEAVSEERSSAESSACEVHVAAWHARVTAPNANVVSVLRKGAVEQNGIFRLILSAGSKAFERPAGTASLVH